MKSEIKKFKNPILTGFYPDPSICRVDEDYYLVTSSFAYFPGLPIFHSKDLVHFSQIGHGISKNNMIDYKECETSLGLWAPTIRYHEGIFYIINTFVSEGREAKRDNFIIRAKEPQGPWSSPIFIDGADGIDPSLFLMKMAPYGIRVILYLKIRCMKVIMVFIYHNLIRKHFSFRENEG